MYIHVYVYIYIYICIYIHVYIYIYILARRFGGPGAGPRGSRGGLGRGDLDLIRSVSSFQLLTVFTSVDSVS